MVEASEIVIDSMQMLFESQIGITPNDSFGSYVQSAYGDNLMLGVSNSPGNDNGGLVASLQPDGTLSLETVVNEQGIHDINVFGDEIVVPGTDPTDGGWNLGNVYRKIDSAWEEFRTLPNVIHAFGMIKIGSEYFVATGAHVGDNTTYSGRVYRSTDLQNWTWVELGVEINGEWYTFRVTEIAKHGSRLYATVMVPVNTTWLFISSDDGQTWTQNPGIDPSIYGRYCIHGDYLCVLNKSLYQIWLFDLEGIVSVLSLGGGKNASEKFNVLASDGERLYVLANDGYIWRTSDLATWQLYSQVTNAISIGYWPSQNCLVVSDKGANAKLWRIAL